MVAGAASPPQAPAQRSEIVAGVIAGPGGPAKIAPELAAVLRGRLERLSAGLPVRVEVVEGPALGRPLPTTELVEVLRERLLSEGWELAVGLTDAPLRIGRRAVVGHASPLHGVALLSIPALGAGMTSRRARNALLRLTDELLGEESGGADRGRQPRLGRLSRRLTALRALGDERGGMATVLTGGYLRLLTGLIWANEPWRFAARLYRVLIAALAAVAFALVTSDLWLLADAMGAWRLAVLTLLSIGASTASLILVHGLWERGATPAVRTQVALFNLATAATVLIGVGALYVVLFLFTAGLAAVFLPRDLLAAALGHPVAMVDLLELAWLVSSLATFGGGLGGGLEAEATVREAAFASDDDDDASGG